MLYRCVFFQKINNDYVVNGYENKTALEHSRTIQNYLCVIGIVENNIMKREINYWRINSEFFERLYEQ